MQNNGDNNNSLPKLRPGVRWNPPKPVTEPHPFEDLPDGDFDPTEEDREAARLASDIGPEILPYED